jgi:hypothetical protein
MGKIFGITSYILFIGLVTFIVSGYARANQTVTYLDDLKEDIYDDSKDLVSATLIANTQGEYHIYIQESPLITHSVNHSNVNYDLEIYSVLLYKNNSDYKYELIFIVTQYKNTDETAFVDEDALSLNIEITFETTPEGFTQSVFNESLIQLYDDSMHMYALDQRYVVDNNARVQRIAISYPTTIDDVVTTTMIHEDVFVDKNLEIPPNNVADLSIFNIERLQLSNVSDRASLYTNDFIIEAFSEYTYMTYLYIGIEIIIVIPITYFIFFHKNMQRIRKVKKEQS